MTILEIVQEVLSEVGEDSSDSELQTLLVGFAKSALRRFPRFTRNKMVRDKKSGTLSLNATTMSLPSGVVTVERMFYETTSGDRQEIEMPGLDQFNELYSGQASGAPQYATIRQRTVEFDRKADQEYTIYFEAIIEIDNVTSSTEFIYSSDRLEILKDGIKFYYYYDYTEDTEKGASKGSLFSDGLNKLETEHTRDEMPDQVEEA